MHPGDRLLDRAAQIAVAHAVLERDIARVALAVDGVGPVGDRDVAQLRERDPLPARRENPDASNRVGGVAGGGQIPDDQIVAPLALEHLAHRRAPDGGFNRALYVGHVDLVARRPIAVDREVEIRLTDDPEEAQILDPRDVVHDGHDMRADGLERAEVVAVDFGRQLAFDAAHRLFHVVGNRLGEAPGGAGNDRKGPVHGVDERVFVLVKHRAPGGLGFEVHEILGVEEPGDVGAVVRPADLARDDGHLGE